MPKHAHSEHTHSEHIDLNDTIERADDNREPSQTIVSAADAATDTSQNLLKNVPADLRAFLLALPRRFLPANELKHQFSHFPHALALEILDGLPAVDAIQREQFAYRDLFGRFTNTLERKFMLVRRNVWFYDFQLLEQMRLLGAERFKLHLASVLQGARHIIYTHVQRNSTNDNTLRACTEIFGKLVSMEVRRGLRSAALNIFQFDDYGRILTLQPIVPLELLPFVTQVEFGGMNSFANSATAFVNDYLPRLKKLVLKACSVPTWDDLALLSQTKLRHLELINTNAGNCSIVNGIVNQTKSLQTLELQGQDLTVEIVEEFCCLAPASIRSILYNIDALDTDMEQLTALRKVQYVLHAWYKSDNFVNLLNSWGRLTSLEVRLETRIRKDIASIMGLDHPKCDLRELEIRAALEVTVPAELFRLVAHCDKLEHFSIYCSAYSEANTHSNIVLKEIAQFLVEQGVLMSCTV